LASEARRAGEQLGMMITGDYDDNRTPTKAAWQQNSKQKLVATRLQSRQAYPRMDIKAGLAPISGIKLLDCSSNNHGD